MGNCASKDKERGESDQAWTAGPAPQSDKYGVSDVGKVASMGNNHSNDYRPDPTRADRIRGDEKLRNGDGRGGAGGDGKKNGFRQQLSVSHSPSHLAAGGVATSAPASGAGRNLKGRVVIALYSYQGSEFGDMSFNKGDHMEIIDDTDPDWWVARNQNTGETGHIPRNYVALLSSLESEE